MPASSGHPVRNARLVLVDDSDLTRAGMRSLLAGESGIAIVGEARNGRQAVELCRRLLPDMAIVDIRMPLMDGLSATRAIKTECPRTSIIILTMHESPEYLREALAAGAAGYLLKDISRRDLIAAIRDVLGGKVLLNAATVAGVIRQMARNAVPSDMEQVETLTAREREVLRLLADGLSNREIGQQLGISTGTIKVHVEHILGKLGVSDRTQAAVHAARSGLLS